MEKLSADYFFSIKKSFVLSSEDREVLSFMYLPIIKKEAFSLYLFLCDLYNLQNCACFINGRSFFEQNGFFQDDVCDSIKRLEAIHLMKTYLKKSSKNSDAEYIFYLYKPYSVTEFFLDPLFSSLLKSVVDEKYLTQLRIHFNYTEKKDIDSSYVDISSKFHEVFTLPEIKNDTLFVDYNPESKRPTGFDIDSLKEELNALNVPFPAIEKNIDVIKNVHSLYGCDTKTLASYIQQSFSLSTMRLDCTAFENLAKINCVFVGKTGFSNKSEESRFEDKKHYSSKYHSLIEFFSTKYCQGKKLSKYQLSTLQSVSSLYPELENIALMYVIDYVMGKTDGILNEKFLFGVCDSLRSNNIYKFDDVQKFLTDFEQRKNEKRTVKRKRDDNIEKKENKKQGFENQIDDDDLFKMMLEDLKKGR